MVTAGAHWLPHKTYVCIPGTLAEDGQRDEN